MPNPRVAALRQTFNEVRSGIEAIEARAASDNRDLTDAEQAQVDTLHTRARQIGEELEPIAERERSMAATADVLSGLGLGDDGAHTRTRRGADDAAPALPSPGQYLAEWAEASAFGNPNRRDDMAAFVERVSPTLETHYRTTAQHYRTVADQLTTDNAAIIPTPILGPVLDFLPSERPVFSSMTQRPMPDKGKTFTRPRITQHVLVDEQTTEKTQLASRKMTLASETVTKRTFGGVLDISQQDIDWTDPGIMDLVLADFAKMYARITEGEACDALEALATNTDDVELGTFTLAGYLTALTTAATTIYGAAGEMPDTLWLSLDSWALLANKVDGQDRPIFPGLALGGDLTLQGGSGTPLSIKPVVGPQLATATMILGVRSLVEAYEQRKGTIQAVNVANFGVDVAYAGYVAFYGRAEGFIGLVDGD